MGWWLPITRIDFFVWFGDHFLTVDLNRKGDQKRMVVARGGFEPPTLRV